MRENAAKWLSFPKSDFLIKILLTLWRERKKFAVVDSGAVHPKQATPIFEIVVAPLFLHRFDRQKASNVGKFGGIITVDKE